MVYTVGENRQLLHQRLQEGMRIKRAAQREQSIATRKLDEEEIGSSDDEKEAEMTDEEASSSSESVSEDERQNNYANHQVVPRNEADTTDGMGKLELSDSGNDYENSEGFTVEDSKENLCMEPLLSEPNDNKQQETSSIRRHIDFEAMTDIFDVEGSDDEFDDHGSNSDHVQPSPVSTRPFAMFSSQPQSDSYKDADNKTELGSETDPLAKQFSLFARADSNTSSTESALQTPVRMCTPDIFSPPSLSRTGSHGSSQKVPNVIYTFTTDMFNCFYPFSFLCLLKTLRFTVAFHFNPVCVSSVFHAGFV